MGKLKYLVIHCSATREGQEITRADIYKWHTGPNTLNPRKVRYMGKDYPSVGHLPNDFIHGVSVRKLSGRGWSQVGYSMLVLLNGTVDVLVPFNNDDIVDPWEATNGVAGINSSCRHVCYVGGMDKAYKKATDTRTTEQELRLGEIVRKQIELHPTIQVAGHNQFDRGKACPSFNVPQWLRSIGVQEKNIYAGKN